MLPKSATKYNLLYRGINFLATLQPVCPTKENFPWLNPHKVDCSKVSTPKGKHSPLNHGTFEPFKNHNQMESKNLWLGVRVWTPHLLS